MSPGGNARLVPARLLETVEDHAEPALESRIVQSGPSAILSHDVWISFPARWTLIMIADTLIAWLLGGMVIVRLVRPSAPALARAAA